MMITSCYGMSVAQLLEKAYLASPDKEAIYDGTRRLAYHDLYREASEIANGLRQIGVKPGDRVAVTLPVWYEFIVIVFAIAKVGAIIVPFNTRYREDEAAHILQDSGAKAAFFPEEYDQVNHLAQFVSLKKRLHTLEHLITVRFEHAGMASYEGLRQAGREDTLKHPDVEIQVKEDVFAIIYTSGTTGKPKGAMLTHNNVVDTTTSYCLALRGSENDVFMHTSPLFHIMGLAAVIRLAVCGAKVVILETYKAERVLQLIEQEKVTVRPGVPTMFILELNHPSFKSYDLSSLRLAVMAAAPCPIEIIRRVKVEMGCPVLVSYGMTETAPTLTFTDFEDDDVIQAETVGRPIKGVEMKVVDDQRQALATGEAGELACRSVGLMKGYYHLPDKTREVIDEDGWFYTGDLATIDSQGYVRIVGRKKDVIIRGGYNIYPMEIEYAFYMHPSVMGVAIVGLPDTVLGEVSCAAMLLNPERPVTSEELKTFIREKVADYKRPDHIIILDHLPRTPSGKVMKHILKDQIISEGLVSLR